MSSRVYHIILLLSCVAGLTQLNTSWAQSVKDTVVLSEFKVSASRSNLPASFFKWSFDSTALSNSPNEELSDFFSDNTAIHMKNYGVDGISSISMRGTSAGHTKVYWNGIALNSPMLGQADASLFPVTFIDNLELHPGTGSVFEGSGGLGGNVVLSNHRSTDKKDRFLLAAGFGSFGTYTQSAKAVINQGKWQFKTTLLNRTAQNNYTYLDYHLDNKIFRRKNAASSSKSAMQEAYYQINSKNELTARIWYVQKEREIPAILGIVENAERQEDESVKTMLTWENRSDRMLTDVNFGGVFDKMVYTDDSIGINSKSSVVSTQLVGNNQYFISDKVKVKSQLRLTFDQAESSGYTDRKSRRSISFLTGFSWKTFKDRLVLDAYARQERWDNSRTYVLPAFGGSYLLGKEKKWIVRANLAGNINFPTLNDQYWINSGNPDLKAEESRGVEFGMANNEIRISKKTSLATDVNFYRNDITNWIVWLPSKGRWTPRNVKSVRNEGIELMLQPKLLAGKNELSLMVNYSCNLSTDVSEDKSSNENYENQLIYVPKNKIAGMLSLKRRKWQFWCRNTFTDQVYLNAANDAYLPSFFIMDAGIKRELNFKYMHSSIQLVIENAMDENYQLIADRPMPGRSYSVNFTIRF